ncbi:MAG: hypothetical protein SOW00_07765, partial [Oscillospiraceae bacterium]|nr:hypothetical protein [Oscillospiraceae bacterium]
FTVILSAAKDLKTPAYTTAMRIVGYWCCKIPQSLCSLRMTWAAVCFYSAKPQFNIVKKITCLFPAFPVAFLAVKFYNLFAPCFLKVFSYFISSEVLQDERSLSGKLLPYCRG